MSAHESTAESRITPTQRYTNSSAGFGILLPARSIPPRMRSIMPRFCSAGPVARAGSFGLLMPLPRP